jgi:hypothetical protein
VFVSLLGMLVCKWETSNTFASLPRGSTVLCRLRGPNKNGIIGMGTPDETE